jgi:hypothetical protein
MGALAGVVVVLVVLLLSHRFGRAEPTGAYRPAVPPAALTTGCYPLPGDATLEFAHQVRRDGDVEVGGELRRILVGQYDEIDETGALAAIVTAFEEVGFVASPWPAPYDGVLQRAGARGVDTVGVLVEQLPGIEDDTIVRGRFVLVLPVVTTPPGAPEVCSDSSSTKRWGGYLERFRVFE